MSLSRKRETKCCEVRSHCGSTRVHRWNGLHCVYHVSEPVKWCVNVYEWMLSIEWSNVTKPNEISLANRKSRVCHSNADTITVYKHLNVFYCIDFLTQFSFIFCLFAWNWTRLHVKSKSFDVHTVNFNVIITKAKSFDSDSMNYLKMFQHDKTYHIKLLKLSQNSNSWCVAVDS